VIIEKYEQKSEEWLSAHLAIPTASQFFRILTPGGELSSQAEVYMYELLAEWATGRHEDSYKNRWMEQGTEREQEARDYYSFLTDAEVEQVGFIYKDEARLTGCSPDGLVKDGGFGYAGGVEFKCPKASTHVKSLLYGRIDPKYVPQVQGSLWLTGLPYWDWVSYHPEMPPVKIRVLPDPVYQRKLDEAVNAFIQVMLMKRQDVRRILPEEGVL
jgi:YqaJ-like recombinase protein